MCRGAGTLYGVNDLDVNIFKDESAEFYMSYVLAIYTSKAKTEISSIDSQDMRPLEISQVVNDGHPMTNYSAFIDDAKGYMALELFNGPPPPDVMGTGWFYLTRRSSVAGVMFDCYPFGL
jgi:hypothetical protein